MADYGYGVIEELLKKTLSLIHDCPCLDGCPSCVHSPKCGSGNKPLDKRAAEFVLEWLLGEPGIEKRVAGEEQAQPLALPEVIPSTNSDLVEHETVASAPTPAWLKEEVCRHRILFLDIETQRSAEEVGGLAQQAFDASSGRCGLRFQGGFVRRI